MDNFSKEKINRQLMDAKKYDEDGHDPDQIMITYSPDEYEKIYTYETEECYVLNENTVNNFPVRLIGAFSFLKPSYLEPDSLQSYNNNFVKLYLNATLNTLLNCNLDDIDEERIYNQKLIYITISNRLNEILTYFNKEVDEDIKLAKSSTNYIQRSELESDVRNTKIIIGRIESLINNTNEALIKIDEILNNIIGSR